MTTKLEKAKLDMVNRVSAVSVKKHTARDWDQWVAVLTRDGAANWEHRQIVLHLRTKYKLTPWWEQGVATGYEIAIGRKLPGQNAKGQYQMSTSRTFPLSTAGLWKLLDSPEGQAIWLKPLSPFSIKPLRTFETEDGIYGQVRTMKVNERARLRWQETEWERPTILQLMLIPRPKEKSILVFQHEQLPEARLRETLRTHWKNVLQNLLDHAATLRKPTAASATKKNSKRKAPLRK